MTLEPRTRHAKESSSHQRLSVATPVFGDVSGECFGMVVIESDLSNQILEAMQGLGYVECEMYVADGNGQLWISETPETGMRIASPDQSIPNLPAEVAARLANEGEAFELHRDGEYVAERFYVERDGRGVLIFARLPDDD
jgi:hypothetical protein